jgi:hypothetical protein
MNEQLRKRLPWIGGAVAAVLVSGWSYKNVFVTPRDVLVTRIEAAKKAIVGLENDLKNRDEVRARRNEIATSLLSGKLDELEHLLRSGLGRVAEQEGLSDVAVENGQPQSQPNHAVLNAKGVQTNLKRQLRSRPDFAVVRGSVKGTGSLEQVLRTVAAVQAQPWVHRFEAVTIRPTGKERKAFEVRLDVATIFAPDIASGTTSTPGVSPATPESEALWRAIAAKNVFKRPEAAAPGATPAVQVVTAPVGTPVAPQPFAPYEDWKLTGIVTSSRGVEAFFMNVRTGSRVTVPQGGVVLDATLVDGDGETAVVEIGGQKFTVQNGQTLAARRLQGSVH